MFELNLNVCDFIVIFALFILFVFRLRKRRILHRKTGRYSKPEEQFDLYSFKSFKDLPDEKNK